MPKIIPDVQYKLLLAARRMIKECDYDKLSIRALAKECGIATGTIYNYFRNKEEMVALVMLDDWYKILAKIDEDCGTAGNIPDGVAIICTRIREFSDMYRKTWAQYGTGVPDMVAKYHGTLREQIAIRINRVLSAYNREDIFPLSDILAEAVLAAALQPDLSEQNVRLLVDKLIK